MRGGKYNQCIANLQFYYLFKYFPVEKYFIIPLVYKGTLFQLHDRLLSWLFSLAVHSRCLASTPSLGLIMSFAQVVRPICLGYTEQVRSNEQMNGRKIARWLD